MAQINPPLPVVGQPVSTEDPKVRDALSDIVDEVNGLLDNNNIAAAANINGTKLLNASIPTGKLEDDAVTADKLRDDATTDDNRAVTTNHIRNDAVTADKLRDSAVTDLDRAVTTNHLRDVSVTTAKIADDAVTEAKLDTTSNWGQDATITYATNYGGTMVVRKYPGNLVTLSSSSAGIMNTRTNTSGSSVTIGDNALMATIPAGYRPSATQSVPAWSLNGTTWSINRVNIESDGEVRVATGATVVNNTVFAVYYNLSYPVG